MERLQIFHKFFNNHGSNEDCVEFRMTSEKWNDKSCSDRLPYICEINGKYNILHEHIYMILRQERK